MINGRFYTMVLSMLCISAPLQYALADSRQCTVVKLSSVGNITVNENLISGGLTEAMMPRPILDNLLVTPPYGGIIEGSFYIDRLSINWSDSHKTKPECRLSIYSPWVGQFWECAIEWKNKPLVMGVLFHTTRHDPDVSALTVRMKQYVEKEFLCD